MKQVFQQFIYCKDGSNINQPKGLIGEALYDTGRGIISNNAGDKEIYGFIQSCIQLGIQAPPGTRFYINGNNDPVIIGSSGILTIDVSKGGNISSLLFDQKSIEYIAGNDSRILIIDTIRNEGD